MGTNKRRKTDWLRQQAEQQRRARIAKEALAAKGDERVEQQAQAKEFITKLIKQTIDQQARLNRLAAAFADRCSRVHELMGQLHIEWERAEAAEARVRELEAGRNGHKKTGGKPSVKGVA